jgi:deazaflavin-dependent oxidoreductase (nitroreductase family)
LKSDVQETKIVPTALAQYVRLETIGRKTKKPHSVLVRYIEFDNKICIFPTFSKPKDWFLNILANQRVRLYYDGKVFFAIARPKRVSDLDHPILSAFARKYGQEVIKREYLGQLNYVEIELEPSAEFLGTSELVYGDLEAAFDAVAETYDEHIFGNRINVWLRNVSVGLLLTVFKPGQTVLEIGCGTGTETLSLAKHGINVVACDISSKMLSVLRKKSAERELSERIVTVHSRPTDLASILPTMGYAKLDGAFSTYGAVNTEPRLSETVKILNGLIRDEGRLVLGVWNKYCLFEFLGYLTRFNPSMSIARFRNPVPIGKSRFCVSSVAFSVGSLVKIVRPYFTLERVYGVDIVLPPSNLANYAPKGERSFAFLKKLDVNLGAAFPFNRIGDHFLAVFRRVGRKNS